MVGNSLIPSYQPPILSFFIYYILSTLLATHLHALQTKKQKKNTTNFRIFDVTKLLLVVKIMMLELTKN